MKTRRITPFKKSKSGLTVIVIISLVTLIGSGCSKQASIESDLKKAHEYLAKENFSAAEIELKNVLKKDSQNAEAVSEMGMLYFHQGRFRNAYPFLNAARDLSPENLEPRLKLASLMLIAGRPEMARQEAAYILSIDPQNSEAPLVISDSIRSLASIEDAVMILDKVETTTPAVLTAKAFLDMKRQALTSANSKLDQALAIDPEFGPAYSGKFAIANAQGKTEEATDFLAKAAEFSPRRSGIKAVYSDYLSSKLGKTEEALIYMEAAAKETPDYLPIITRLAELYAQQGQVEAALELNDKTLKLDPMEPAGLRLKGVLAATQGKYEDAIATLTSMLELYPEDIKANYQLALSYIATNQKAKAKAPLNFVNSKFPGNLETAVLLANMQIEDSDYSGAIITLKNLSASRPDSQEAKLLLAEVYNRQGNYESALAIYDALEAANNKAPDIRYLSGVTLLKSNDNEKARESFESALKTNPLHLQSVEQLTALDLNERNYDSALDRVNESLKLAPDTPILYVIKAQIQNSMGQLEEAEAAYLRAVELDPRNRMAHTLLSRFYINNERPNEAIEQLKIVLAEKPDDLPVLFAISDLYEKLGRMSEAIEKYDAILELVPRNLMALNNLAYIISTQRGPTDRAAELAEKAREVAPTNPYTADTLGWILYQRKDYIRARALLLDSLAKLPNHPEINYHVGSAQYMLGNITEAKARLDFATKDESTYSGYEDAKLKLAVLAVVPADLKESGLATLEDAAETKDPVALTKLGQIEKAKGDSQKAIDLYRQAIKSTPLNLYAQLELASELANVGKTAEALELAKAAAKQEPNDILVAYVLGKVAYQSKDYVWSASLLSQVVRQLPNNADAQSLYASAQLTVGKLSESIEASKKAASLLTNTEAKEKANSMVKLLEYIQNPNTTPPIDGQPSDSLAVRLAISRQALANSEREKAKADLESIIKDYPNQAQAKIDLATLLVESSSSAERAYELAGDSRRIMGTTPTVLAVQGIARYQQNQYRQSAQLFSQIETSKLSSSIWKYYYGMAALKIDDKELGTRLLSEAVELGLPSELDTSAKEALGKSQS